MKRNLAVVSLSLLPTARALNGFKAAGKSESFLGVAGFQKTLTTANSHIIKGNEAYGKINEIHHMHMHSYYIYTYIYMDCFPPPHK